jgi:hypothetical protein
MSSSHQPQPIPQPSLNGGLYTGAPFQPNAPWANHPVAPDAGYYNFGSLRDTPAPVAARYMVPGGGLRPGNNTPLLPPDYADSKIVSLNAICIPTTAFAPSGGMPSTPGDNPGKSFRQYSYVM